MFNSIVFVINVMKCVNKFFVFSKFIVFVIKFSNICIINMYVGVMYVDIKVV